jgi:hypothetical protein
MAVAYVAQGPKSTFSSSFAKQFTGLNSSGWPAPRAGGGGDLAGALASLDLGLDLDGASEATARLARALGVLLGDTGESGRRALAAALRDVLARVDPAGAGAGAEARDL